MCENFADGFVARIQVKLSLTLLIAGVFGFVFECLNAFEYLQGTRLALIDSSLAVTSMLFILCFVRGELKSNNLVKYKLIILVCLIYMNFLIWLRRWKAIFTDFVATYKLNMLQGIYEDVLKSMAFAVTILLHDAAYQFLRRVFKLVQT